MVNLWIAIEYSGIDVYNIYIYAHLKKFPFSMKMVAICIQILQWVV